MNISVVTMNKENVFPFEVRDNKCTSALLSVNTQALITAGFVRYVAENYLPIPQVLKNRFRNDGFFYIVLVHRRKTYASPSIRFTQIWKM